MEDLRRRTSAEELRKHAETRVAEAEGAEDQRDANRLLRYAAGLEMQAFSMYAPTDIEGRNLSGLRAVGLWYEIGDFLDVVEKAQLVLESLGAAVYPETRAQMQEMISKAQAELVPLVPQVTQE